MRTERDVVLFKKLAHFYSFTGNFPYIHRKDKVLLIVFYINGIMGYFNGYLKYLTLKSITSYIGLVVSGGTILLMFGFSSVCLRHAFSHRTLWNDLFTDVDTFDILLKEEGFILKENVYKFYFKFGIATVVVLSVYFSIVCIMKFDYQDICGISFYFLASMQVIVTALSIEKLVIIIEKRFELLTRNLRETYLFSKQIQNGQQLATSYLVLMNIIRKINKIFGRKILIILLNTFLYVLHWFHFVSFEILEWSPTILMELCGVCFLMIVFLVSKYTDWH